MIQDKIIIAFFIIIIILIFFRIVKIYIDYYKSVKSIVSDIRTNNNIINI